MELAFQRLSRLIRLNRCSFAAVLDHVCGGVSWGHEPRRFQFNVQLDLGPASEKWREEMAVMKR